MDAVSGLSYRLLRSLSHSRNRRGNAEIAVDLSELSYDHAYGRRVLSTMERYVDHRNKTVLDIGCGTGNMSICLAKSGAKRVVGVDVDGGRIETARRKAEEEGVDNVVSFTDADFVHSFTPDSQFDIAYSQNAMEHILAPEECLSKVHGCLAPGGVLATRFGPLWGSPFGAHMSGFTIVPWVHFVFPERVVLKVRSEVFRPDEPAERYEDIRGHLNRMTVKRFLSLATSCGFSVVVSRINPSLDHGLLKWANHVVNALPVLREPASHVLLAVLRKPAERQRPAQPDPAARTPRPNTRKTGRRETPAQSTRDAGTCDERSYRT